MEPQPVKCPGASSLLVEVQALEEVVERRIGRRVRDFRVEIRGNGLILHGLAPTYHAKQLAQDAVMRASRRPLLSNRIAVARTTGAPELPMFP